nr:DNA-protecting protein DprA [Pyrinomonadaceae bacterium]
HIDALAEASKLAVPELSSALLGLEMRELIRQLPGKCFVRKL